MKKNLLIIVQALALIASLYYGYDQKRKVDNAEAALQAAKVKHDELLKLSQILAEKELVKSVVLQQELARKKENK